MALPRLTLRLRLIDPSWKAVFGDGSPRAINADSMYKDFDVEVEVVQLNLNSGGMRVRYEWPNKHRKSGMEICTQDVSIAGFFDKYELREKVTEPAVQWSGARDRNGGI